MQINQLKLKKIEEVDEGAKEMLTSALLAAFLAVPGIVDAKDIDKTLKTKATSSEVCKTINKKSPMLGEYTAFQAANIIARTLYAEAQQDGKTGFNAVASVIYNRANGKREDFVKVCFKEKQFSCWNKMTDSEKSPENFVNRIPKNVKDNKNNQKLWNQCMEIAATMIANKSTFKPTTTANSYYATNIKNKPSWSKELTDTKTIGSHIFGTLKKHVKFV